jgi:hypothetical protein
MRRLIRLCVVGLLFVPLTVFGAPPEFNEERLAQIDDPLRVAFPAARVAADKEKIRQAIAVAAASRSWKIESEVDGRMELSVLVRDKHMARVELAYDVAGYRIRYLDSRNLRYDAQQNLIHRNYNVWIRELAAGINAALKLSVPILAGAETAPGVAPPASPNRPASEGLPSVGATWKYGFRDQRYTKREQLFTVSVIGVDGWTVLESFWRDGAREQSQSSIEAREPWFAARPLAGGYNLVELAPYSPALYQPGAVAAAPARYPGGSWKIDAPRISEEQATVPAGTFKTVRIDVSGRASVVGTTVAPGRFEYTAWYVPAIKRYVRARHQTWNQAGTLTGDEIIQLREYGPQ